MRLMASLQTGEGEGEARREGYAVIHYRVTSLTSWTLKVRVRQLQVNYMCRLGQLDADLPADCPCPCPCRGVSLTASLLPLQLGCSPSTCSSEARGCSALWLAGQLTTLRSSISNVR